MRHVDKELTALVDGQLPTERRERVLAHLVHCPRCSALARAERASRRALHDTGPVDPPADLTDRLLALPASAPPPAPVPAWAQRVIDDRRARRRLVVSLSGVAAGAVGAFGVLVTVGVLAEREATPADMLADVRSAPAVDPGRLAVLASPAGAEEVADDAVAPVEADLSDTDAVLAWMAQEGWATPASLPAGLHVTDVRVDPGATVLEVELVGGDTHVRLIEQPGRLEPDVVAELEAVEVDGGTVHRLPWAEHGYVVQCAENLVMVVASSAAGGEVAAALPQEHYDTGVLGRLDRGWDTLTAWTQDAAG